MTARTIIVSAFDKNYFPFYREQLQSLVECCVFDRYDLGVVDAGLTTDQIVWLKNSGVAAIVAPDWPFPEAAEQPLWYKACLGRPFFDDYFSDWDIVIYLDADSWVQNLSIVDYAVAGVREDGFAVVPVSDRSHWPLSTPVNAGYSMHWHKECLVRYFGQEIADRYQLHPILHGSFFAGQKGAPHWREWREAMALGLKRHMHFNVDQASMTIALHASNHSTHFLPVHLHWISHLATVGLDTNTGLFVEPYQPHVPLSSITLAADTKTEPVMVRTVDGRLLRKSLRYSQRHESRPLSVNIGGASVAFDGIALPRFTRKLLQLAVEGTDFLRLQITGQTAAQMTPQVADLRSSGFSCYITNGGDELIALQKESCTSHFGII